MGKREIQRVEVPDTEMVAVYCYDCDTIDLIREMHPGHRVLLIGMTGSGEDKLDKARQLGRQYFIDKQRRRGDGPFAGNYGNQERSRALS